MRRRGVAPIQSSSAVTSCRRRQPEPASMGCQSLVRAFAPMDAPRAAEFADSAARVGGCPPGLEEDGPPSGTRVGASSIDEGASRVRA